MGDPAMNPATPCNTSLSPGGRGNRRIAIALGLVMLLQVGMFCDSHYERWRTVIAPLNQPTERVGEGLVIGGNGLGYYAWLRSLLIDGDWDFDNEFDQHVVAGDWVPPPTYRTPLGKRANQWSVGPACFWAIFIVPGHYIIKAIDPTAANGYSLPYQLLVGVAAFVSALIGLVCLYGICRHFARPSRAALATAFITLSSTLTYYWSVEVSMAHGLGASALAVYVWYWLKTYGSLSARRWALVGFLMGIACLMRWQLATFAVLPLGEAVLCLRRRNTLSPGGRGQGEGVGFLLLRFALFALSALLAFSPQMIAWKLVYGQWLVETVPGIAHHWLSPALWQVLLSQDRSLFYWTPICAFASIGFCVCSRGCNAGPLALAFAAFSSQVYALASVWGKGEYLPDVGNFAGAYLSRAYGMRHLTEAVIVLAPGLVLLYERASRLVVFLLCGIGVLLSVWNLGLILQFNSELLPADCGLDLSTLIQSTFRFVRSNMFAFLGTAEMCVLICLVLVWRAEAPG